MWVIHEECICEECKQFKNCKEQRIIEDMQKLLAHIKPDDVSIQIYVEKCPRFECRELSDKCRVIVERLKNEKIL